MVKHIRCAKCRFAQQDTKASEYTQKRCGKCESRRDCEVCQGCEKRDDCKVYKSLKTEQSCERRLDAICSQQKLKWAAIQCTHPESEYNRALLNVTPSGDPQDRVTWGGCPLGEKRCVQ